MSRNQPFGKSKHLNPRAPRHGWGLSGLWVGLALLGLGIRTEAQPGKIDLGFSVPGLRSTTALTTTPDGRVVVAGNFTNSVTFPAVAILAADGSVAWQSEPLTRAAQLLAVGGDGAIYAGGDSSMARFRPPATAPDATFAGGSGWRTMDPWAMAVQPDGALLIAGSGPGGAVMDWQADRGLRNLPFRILPSGVRDAVFATRVGTGPCTDLAVLPDGSFLAARTSIQRFLADGTLDASFTPWVAANVELLQRLPSGDFLVGGGAFNSFRGAPAKSLIRVRANGERDPSFDYAGVYDTFYDAVGAHRPLAVLADGRFVVGQPAGGILRFLANGAVDGTWTNPVPGVVAKDLVADARGQIYVAASLEGVGKSKALYRLAGDDSGPLDERPVFTTQPAASTSVVPGESLTLSVGVVGQPEPMLQWYFNGEALVGQTRPGLTLSPFRPEMAGAYEAVASNRVGVVRTGRLGVFVSPGAARPGSPDVTFESPPLNPGSGVAGFVPTTVNPVFWGGAPTPEGGLYLWGNFVFRGADGVQQLGVVRLTPVGDHDSAFRTGDTIRDAGGGVGLPEGGVVLGAVFVAGSEIRNGVVRLDANGAMDGAFANSRWFDGTQQASARIVARQADGGLLVGGTFDRVGGAARPGLFRLRSDGTLDSGFPALPVSSRVTSLAVAADGGIYLGGSFSLPGATVASSLIRLNPDGSLDGGFKPLTLVAGLVGMEALPAGGVVGLTAGVAQTLPVAVGSLFRLEVDGTVDGGFDAGLPNRIGSALLRRADGTFLVAGDPGSAPGVPAVARHLAGGLLDPFYTNAPAATSVRALLPSTNGAAWIVTAGYPGAMRLRGDDYVPPVPPAIVRQPRSLSASGLTAASFRVVADGVRPLAYQWRFNGVPLTGETAEQLNVAPVTPQKLGVYDVVVTGGGASTTSQPAVLSNQFPPEIVVQPLVRTNVFVGATVTFGVEATGTAPLRYQWRFNGSEISGATGSTLVLDDLRLDQQGLYTVVVRNDAGSVESRAVDLKVSPLPVPPAITHEPEDAVLVAGVGQVCLEVGVTGTGPVGFQWQREGVDVPGAILTSLCVGPLVEGEIGRYRLVVTNAWGRAVSREAIVTAVAPVFAITQSPSEVNLVPDRAALFSVTVRNDAGRPLTYRWQRDGVDIPGATEDRLRLDPPTLADAGARFRVIVSDGVTTLTSDAATATARPEVISCPSAASSIFRLRGAPLPIEMGVDARGFGTLTYQWRRGPVQVGKVEPLEAFVAVAGGTGPRLVLSAPREGDVGDYFCEVRSEFGTSVVPGAAQAGAIRVRLVEEDQRPGRVDFAWDYLALGDVWALNGVEFLDDGRVYVAGAFGNPLVGCDPLRLLARLKTDGTLDPTFQPVTAGFGTAVGLVRQPGGKLVIAGDFRGVPGLAEPSPGISVGWARFTAEGTLDPSFRTAELPFNGSGGTQIAGQRDGRILIVRNSSVYRLLPDGGKDATFGGPIDNQYSPGIEAGAEVRRMIVDGQDRVLLLTAHAVKRYLPNGQPDPAWTATQVSENLIRMAVGTDGRVVATGYPAEGGTGVAAVRVVRFQADGTRDAAFQPEYPVGGTIAGAPGVQPDGSVLIAGTAGTLSARLTPSGGRDASWDSMASPGGVTFPAFEPYWYFAPDGRALVAAFGFDEGIGFSTPGQRHLHRLHNGGSAAGQVRLDVPRFADGHIVFEIATEAGRNYEVQFLGELGGGGGATMGWSTRQTIVGDGTRRTVALGTSGSVGFYRVVVRP